MTTITTVRDLRNWVHAATCNWHNRDEDMFNRLVDAIAADSPDWGDDWSEYLDSLPDNLADMLVNASQIDMSKPVLYAYDTAEEIRNATAEELAASIEASKHDGGAGVIEVDGVSCYVQE